MVEGRYDRNTLLQAVDATVVEVGGFSLFHDDEKTAYLRDLAEKNGIILMTDADSAGFVIRNHLKGCLPPERVKQAYIPDVYGKERRKKKPGKEGKLGVEGMRPEVLLAALKNAGVEPENTPQPTPKITKTDLFLAGLSGGKESAEKRRRLQHRLLLPEHLGSNAFLDALNLLMTREEFLKQYGANDD